MNPKHQLLGFMVLTALLLTPYTRALAQTSAMLHATPAEVTIWKQRATTGPYKEGWTYIKGRADSFVSNPGSRWAGKTSNTCYDQDVDPRAGRTRDAGLRDAGLAYLITGNNTYRDAVRSALAAQTAVPGTNFADTGRWCVASSASAEQEVANWIRRLAYGYSFIRQTLSATERAPLDTWFLNAGRFYSDAIHNAIVSRFPNRLANDYTSCSASNACPGGDNGTLYFGGPKSAVFSQVWANKPSAQAATVAAIGIVVGDAGLKASAKRFFQEWLKFAVWPGGEVFDQHRWHDSPVKPQIGYSYAGTAIGSIVSIADHFARSGDPSLYEFSTSEGRYGTEGGSKSLLKVLQHFAGLTTGTKTQYASNTATSNPDLRIFPFGPSENRILYLVLAPANVYYRRSELKSAYSVPLPSSWDHGGYDARGGDWGSYSDILFMFGQMENAVWPYNTDSGTPAVPPSPGNLQIVQGG
jgi:hypothetical protein